MTEKPKAEFFPLISANPTMPIHNHQEPLDDLPPRATILRIKRKRTEDSLEAIVLEANQPERKKRQMQKLSEALSGMKVAHELHQQFLSSLQKTTSPATLKDAELVNKGVLTKKESEVKIEGNKEVNDKSSEEEENPFKPLTNWSAPTKTLENQLKKLFRFIGSDDPQNAKSGLNVAVTTLVNDIQTGKAKKRDIVNAIERRTVEGERRARVAENSSRLQATRTAMLRKVISTSSTDGSDSKIIQPIIAGEGEDEEEFYKMLELIQEESLMDSTASTAHTPSTQVPSRVKLPTVYSARELELQALKRAKREAQEADFVIDYYIMDEDAVIADMTNIQAVQVPLAIFKQELLNDYVLEGEYSDEELDYHSDDSQNREGDWEYGSDPDDEDSSNPNSDQNVSDVDEMMDEDGDYYHDRHRHRGYDLEIDPSEPQSDDEDY